MPALAGHEEELSAILKEFTGIVVAAPLLTADHLMSAWILCAVCSLPAFRHGERGWQVEGRASARHATRGGRADSQNPVSRPSAAWQYIFGDD